MIYMVEMDFRETAREHDWHTWYLMHTTQLVRNVPGFTATQRFRCLTPTKSPWLALHEVTGPDVFESKEYKAVGGPASTGEWQHQHTNWTRNAYAGIDNTPDVPLDAHLLVADAGAKLPASLAANVTWLENVGLDAQPLRTAQQGLGVDALPKEAELDLPGGSGSRGGARPLRRRGTGRCLSCSTLRACE